MLPSSMMKGWSGIESNTTMPISPGANPIKSDSDTVRSTPTESRLTKEKVALRCINAFIKTKFMNQLTGLINHQQR